MEEIFLITGATGFLGRTVAEKLMEQGKEIVGLRLPGDKGNLLEGVNYQMGDITKIYTLDKFFEQAKGKKAILIHCAGLVTIASQEKKIWEVNVDGTRNIVDLCEKYQISRLVYVSSVHAIPEKEKGRVICETNRFSASLVEGIYGKSKAEATAYVQRAAQKGLDAVIVHPSGIIGPGDDTNGYMTETIRLYLKGYFPTAIEGGYDFVDVRDVADGIINCVKMGKQGETYILSGEYLSVRRLFDIISNITGKKKVFGSVPLNAIRWTAPVFEKVCRMMQCPLLITPYSVYTLGSNGDFSHEKAARELAYAPRPIEETLADTVAWLT